MRPLLLGLGLAALSCACAPAAGPRPPTTVPLRSLRLYETGVGYFERTGRTGGQDVLPVPTSHLDDALKSLVILGPGSHVRGVTFPSHLSGPMARSLVGLPGASGERLGYRELLESLKGSAVELSSARGEGAARGRLVELLEEEAPRPRPAGAPDASKGDGGKGEAPAPRLVALLMTDDGSLRRIALDDVSAVQPLDPTFRGRLGASLDAAATRGAQARRELRLLGDGAPVTFGYIAETPVWRTSYRLLLEGDQTLLQGWALLHNDTDEDWRDVQLTLVNGRPDSFLFPLAAPRYQRRELVHPEQPLPTVPQLLGQGADALWTDGEEHGAGGLGLSGVGEGGGGRGEGIGLGSVGTIGHGSGTGSTSGSSLLSVGNLAGVAQATGSEQGALFSYAIGQPVTMPAHSSALMPFLEQRVKIRPITWLDGGARAGVRFENTTGQTLPAGTVAFFGNGGFAGESTLDRLKPGERRFVTFAADLDVEQLAHRQTAREETRRVTRSGQAVVEHFLRTTEHALSLDNRSPRPRSVYVALSLHRNAQVTGADALDFDTSRERPVAIFELGPRQKLERPFTSVEGLSRSDDVEQVEPARLQRLADSPGLPADEKAALRELIARRAEQQETTRALGAIDHDRAEQEQDIERLRRNLEALGGDKATRPDANPFVRRILAAEDRLAELRKRQELLKNQLAARQQAVLAALRRLPATGP